MATMMAVRTLLIIQEHQIFSDFANADITTPPIAQNENDKKDDRQIEGNIMMAQNRDRVGESVIRASIILYHIVHLSYINVLQPGYFYH
jgi:hypothetical protein